MLSFTNVFVYYDYCDRKGKKYYSYNATHHSCRFLFCVKDPDRSDLLALSRQPFNPLPKTVPLRMQWQQTGIVFCVARYLTERMRHEGKSWVGGRTIDLKSMLPAQVWPTSNIPEDMKHIEMVTPFVRPYGCGPVIRTLYGLTSFCERLLRNGWY